MEKIFEEPLFREFNAELNKAGDNLIKSSDAELAGKIKVSVEEESHDGVKIIVQKDGEDNIKEIKFVCSCGQTKSIILDYSE